MSREKYTHVQVLLPEIRAMEATGKTKREIAEHFGLRDTYVVEQLIARERRKEAKAQADILPRPKAVPEKTDNRHIRTRRQNWNSCGWRISCCGIFCN